MYEMGTPMYIDAVEAKAKRDGGRLQRKLSMTIRKMS